MLYFALLYYILSITVYVLWEPDFEERMSVLFKTRIIFAANC